MSCTRQKRRWFRFSLRTLLIVMTLACAGFGWLGYEVRQKQREREAIEAIRRLGGVVLYDYKFDAAGNQIQNAVAPGPDWLKALLGDDFFAHVEGVVLLPPTDEYILLFQMSGRRLPTMPIGFRLTDDDLVHLQSQKQLKELMIRWPITDAGLVHLQGLTQLESLYLFDTQVTDAGCEALKSHLPRLKIERDSTEQGIE